MTQPLIPPDEYFDLKQQNKLDRLHEQMLHLQDEQRRLLTKIRQDIDKRAQDKLKEQIHEK